MEKVVLHARMRSPQGTGAARGLRRHGEVPAILYGSGRESVALRVQARDLERILCAGQGVLVSLRLEDRPEVTAVIADVQRHVLDETLQHVDFHRVRMDETIHHTLPIAYHGRSEGERDGGVIEHVRHAIDVEGTPAQMPERVEVSVSPLRMGEALHVRDIALPLGVHARTDPDEVVVVVHPPRALEASAVASAEAEAQFGAPVLP